MSIQHLDSGDILSQAVTHDGTVYLCGLTATDREKDVAAQTEEVLAKIDERLAACGTNKSNLVSATIYLTDIKLKPAMNEAWKAWLGNLNRPSRTCIGGVELEPGVLVEITSTAAK